ncbi:MAG: hypothetical protein ACLP3Q_16035 [Streptosporangiaceae bacterium]
MTDQPSLKAAARILADRDPVIDRLLFLTGPPELAPPVEGNFAALVRAIVYQQLAGRAAAAIHGPDADRAGAPAARRGVPALPVGGGLVLLAGRGT